MQPHKPAARLSGLGDRGEIPANGASQNELEGWLMMGPSADVGALALILRGEKLDFMIA